MRNLSVIRQKSLTKQNETDTCPLTDSKLVHVIDPTISLLSDFLTDSLPSIWRTHVKRPYRSVKIADRSLPYSNVPPT